jgi:nucleotide-binding universal stress UspA family protein
MPNVLIALDDSEASERVEKFAERFFAVGEYTLSAVSVALAPVSWIPPATPFGFVYPWSLETQSDIAAEMEGAAAERAESVVATANVDADETLTKIGDPVQAILDAADEVDADLLVVGSNHKGFFERLVFGSVSDQILKDTDRPVLPVP